MASVHASNRLHRLLLQNIVRVPLLFFDCTPLGQILNRFAADIYLLDDTIPCIMDDALSCGIDVICTIVIISLVTPMFLIAFVGLTVIFVIIQVSAVVMCGLTSTISVVIVLSERFTRVMERSGQSWKTFLGFQRKVREHSLHGSSS